MNVVDLMGGLPISITGEVTQQSTTQVVADELTNKSFTSLGKPLKETADSVLIRTKECQWNRYLKNVLNLPDWIDLGLEHRTRFEVYDHPGDRASHLEQPILRFNNARACDSA